MNMKIIAINVMFMLNLIYKINSGEDIKNDMINTENDEIKEFLD